MDFVGIPGTGHVGGIMVCWKKSEPITCSLGANHAIYMIVNQPQGDSFLIVGVYANSHAEVRRRFWSETTDILNTGLPSVVAGDFNVLLDPADKKDLQSQLETFWAQRSRLQWVREGDRISNFFHAKLQRRRARNRITEIHTLQGQKVNSSEEIQRYAKEYFSDHWASKVEQHNELPPDILPKKFSNDMKEELVFPFSEYEIEEVVKRLPKNRAPGPDGYPKTSGKSITQQTRGPLHEQLIRCRSDDQTVRIPSGGLLVKSLEPTLDQ
ncbi:hypothetical protein QJS10_CPA10g01337 [Acorus calamus]|uniref:Endonuclease/exonuclease/phosphatase domain-containing protein n=1 Tax=Acorus calamus TaxID=4465 RepID=A0AAV9DY05_ACOCL|nr:hypothetical protein QJS10_CPA10g01337 [Acorus calamus]